MRLAALLSGGKDSLYAAYLAEKQGHEIKTIISIKSDNPESYMFHVPNVDLVKVQAEAMNIPLITKRTKGEKEKELDDLSAVIREVKEKHKIEGIVTGALASSYQKARIDNICKESGLQPMAPLWHADQEKYLHDLLRDGFSAVIVAVAAPPMDDKWLGRELNEDAIEDLVKLSRLHGISMVGEGGEFDTFVTDCPLFTKRIEILKTKKVWDAKTRSGWLDIREVRLSDKSL